MTNPQILKAQPVVSSIKNDLILRCNNLKQRGFVPKMSVVLVGDNPASLSYVRNKKKMCEEIGGEFELHQLSDNISESDFLREVDKLNHDPKVHGIIIQLPVGKNLKDLNVFELIQPHKDIDGFHPENTKKLYLGETNLNLLLPCTPKGIVRLLNHYRITIEGKRILVIGRSLIVGKPLSMLLSNLNATVTLAHSGTKNLKELTNSSDIIITAIGRPKYLDQSFFSHNPSAVVVDVGISSFNSQIVGDVNFDQVAPIVSAISPVPGGVGPMTVVSLIENLISATETQSKGKI